MPTLPLYETSGRVDAWHKIIAPGGYEAWHFDAEDPATDTRFVATFFEGYMFHPAYLRKYSAYLRRPTRCRPPVPNDFPGVSVAIYRAGKILARFATQYAPGDFEASTSSPFVRIGPNRITRDDNGDYRLHVEAPEVRGTWNRLRRKESGSLEADLLLRPRWVYLQPEGFIPSSKIMGVQHNLLVPATVGETSGSIRFRSNNGQDQHILLNGPGYRDHLVGTAPVGIGLWRWMRGRILLQDRLLTFQIAHAPDRYALPPDVHLVEAGLGHICEFAGHPLQIPGERCSKWGLRFPRELHFGDRLKLTDAHVLDSSPFAIHLRYSAHHSESGAGTAYCEIVYPHRMRWPIVHCMSASF